MLNNNKLNCSSCFFVQSTIRKDSLFAACGVSLWFILSPYLRSLVSSQGVYQRLGVFATCRNYYSLALSLLPPSSIIRRVPIVGGLVVMLPSLLPAKTTTRRTSNNNIFINSKIYDVVETMRNVFIYPLLEINLFHKVLFLRVLPLLGPVGAHSLTAVAYTVASMSHEDIVPNPIEMMSKFNESLLMQGTFFFSGGRILYPFVFHTILEMKSIAYQAFNEFNIFEHSQLYRQMVHNSVKDNLKVYGVPDTNSRMSVYIDNPSQNTKIGDSETSSPVSQDQNVNDFAMKVLTKFSSSSSGRDGLNVLDAADFIYAFRAAVGRSPTRHIQPPLVNLKMQDISKKSNGLNGMVDFEGNNLHRHIHNDGCWMPLPVDLIPVLCNDLAYTIVLKKYHGGMTLDDIKGFYMNEISTSNLNFDGGDLPDIEKELYRLWPCQHDDDNKDLHSPEVILHDILQEYV